MKKIVSLSWCLLYKPVLFTLCIKEGIIVHSTFVSVDSFVIICFHLFHRFLFQFLFICFIVFGSKKKSSKQIWPSSNFLFIVIPEFNLRRYVRLVGQMWISSLTSFLLCLLPTIYLFILIFTPSSSLASHELNDCRWTLNRNDKKIQYWMKYSKLKINEIKFSWDFVV